MTRWLAALFEDDRTERPTESRALPGAMISEVRLRFDEFPQFVQKRSHPRKHPR